MITYYLNLFCSTMIDYLQNSEQWAKIGQNPSETVQTDNNSSVGFWIWVTVIIPGQGEIGQ